MSYIPSFHEDQISQIPALQVLQNLGYTYLTPEEALDLRGGKSSEVILDGVLEQQTNYKKSGFKLAYRNIRFEGVIGGNPPDTAGIVQLYTLPFETIDSYDRSFFPANRSRFTKSWINQTDADALGIMKGDQLAGYGVIRQCLSGYKIGPLFADNPELAESLFLALMSKAKPSEFVYLDTPEVNQAAIALAERYSMKVSFETARMYSREKPDMPLNRIYGVTSFEIG